MEEAAGAEDGAEGVVGDKVHPKQLPLPQVDGVLRRVGVDGAEVHLPVGEAQNSRPMAGMFNFLHMLVAINTFAWYKNSYRPARLLLLWLA